jgi:hypothetical protein
MANFVLPYEPDDVRHIDEEKRRREIKDWLKQRRYELNVDSLRSSRRYMTVGDKVAGIVRHRGYGNAKDANRLSFCKEERAGPKRRHAAEGRPSLTKRSVTRKKRPAIKKKERKVDEARRRLMRAETALAAEELPDLTRNR